jgi:hypothetical protein
MKWMSYLEIGMKIIEHLHQHIDIILMDSVTMLGFMIASLSILKMVIPLSVEKTKSLYADIIKWFKWSIYLLIGSTVISTLSFFLMDVPYMEYCSLIAYIVFAVSIFFIIKSVNIIFVLEE